MPRSLWPSSRASAWSQPRRPWPRSPASATAPCAPGATGTDVRALQRTLNAAGIRVKVDGQFGSATVRAVKRFQRAAQLTPSGVVGRKTLAALTQVEAGAGAGGSSGYDLARSTTKSKASLGSRVPLKRGMRGQDIRVLQDFLHQAPATTVSVDGDFGSEHADGGQGASSRRSRDRSTASWTPPTSTPCAPAAATGAAAGAGAGARRSRRAGHARPRRPRHRARGRAGAGQADHRRRQPDRQQALQVRRRPRASWEDTGYDCSGSVSYALHGAGLLEQAAVVGRLRRLGRLRARPVGHDLRPLGPHVHGRRRPALRHQRPERRTTPAGRPRCARPPATQSVTPRGCRRGA